MMYRSSLLALLVVAAAGNRVSTRHQSAVSATVTLARPGIQCSLPAGWKTTGREYSASNHSFSPSMPQIGVVYLANGQDHLVLGYQMFDPKQGPVQRQRWGDFARYRRSRSAKRYSRFRGIEAVQFEYEKLIDA